MKTFVNIFTQENYGTTLEDAQEFSLCVTCGGPATDFRDALSTREYQISGMCQSCQDNVFAEPDDLIIDQEFDE